MKGVKRQSRAEARAFEAEVDAALARKSANKVDPNRITRADLALYAQLGAYHRLQMKREHPALYAALERAS